MAKTLDQLAKESLKEKGYLLTSLDGMHMAEIEAINMFKRGANAVLEEIERVAVINKGDDRPWLLRGNHLYNVLMDKIKQLKGE